ncbi:MerR family transcriptional regulator [Bacillus carboniphilus]|uniref:MerR family transcriptional regulator n=1 Tax=Bacillus carboniphilus TaxID=86663 RepID=A0ABP3GH23_9BACI
MGDGRKFLIGEFSERTGTSIRTLHYYDEIGLLTPEKNPSSGHRLYTDKDVVTLQKIVSLKFLGYSLEQITEMIHKTTFDVSLNDSLHIQKRAFEEKKEQIEAALTSINRVITILEEEGEVDSTVLMSLIHNIQSEKDLAKWLEERAPKEVVDHIFNMPEEEKLSMDKLYVRFSKDVKKLYGKPVQDPEVKELITDFMKETMGYIGDDAAHALGEIDSAEAEQLIEQYPSPFTKEEEAWLNQAMEYYMELEEKLAEQETTDELEMGYTHENKTKG